MTYRRNWPDPIINPRSGISFDSDTGWGCTVRCGQMLVARIIFETTTSSEQRKREYLFGDEKNAPFGMHAFLAKSPNLCGEWIGPTTISLILQNLLFRHSTISSVVSTDGYFEIDEILKASSITAVDSSTPDQPSLEASPRSAGGFVDVGLLVPTVHSAATGIGEEEVWFIDEQENIPSLSPRRQTSSTEHHILKTPILDRHNTLSWQRPVLLTVAIRLSVDDHLPSSAIRPLLAYMTLPSFVGMLGGPDRRCHYLVGFLTESLEDEESVDITSFIAVDPHIVQEAVVGGDTTSCLFDDTFKNSPHPLRVSPNSLCPTVAVSFLVHSESDLDLLKSQLDEIHLACSSDSHAFIHIKRTDNDYMKNRSGEGGAMNNVVVVLNDEDDGSEELQ